jgi:hypothetical protein
MESFPFLQSPLNFFALNNIYIQLSLVRPGSAILQLSNGIISPEPPPTSLIGSKLKSETPTVVLTVVEAQPPCSWFNPCPGVLWRLQRALSEDIAATSAYMFDNSSMDGRLRSDDTVQPTD